MSAPSCCALSAPFKFRFVDQEFLQRNGPALRFNGKPQLVSAALTDVVDLGVIEMTQ
jgi:hypothetical protein